MDLWVIPDKSTPLQVLAEVESGSESPAVASRGFMEQIFPFLLYLKAVFLCWAVNNESSWHYMCRGIGGILKERWGSLRMRAQQEKQPQQTQNPHLIWVSIFLPKKCLGPRRKLMLIQLACVFHLCFPRVMAAWLPSPAVCVCIRHLHNEERSGVRYKCVHRNNADSAICGVLMRNSFTWLVHNWNGSLRFIHPNLRTMPSTHNGVTF